MIRPYQVEVSEVAAASASKTIYSEKVDVGKVVTAHVMACRDETSAVGTSARLGLEVSGRKHYLFHQAGSITAGVVTQKNMTVTAKEGDRFFAEFNNATASDQLRLWVNGTWRKDNAQRELLRPEKGE